MANIVCESISKSYESQPPVVHDFTIDIDDGEFVVFLGPSGCGKSTILRMVAGLEDISGGKMKIGDRVVNDLPARERNIAMVFQNYALYPHMTVYDNIAFGLRRLKMPEKEIAAKVAHVTAMLNLDGLLDRKPRAMSGGQQQRAAIARAMIKTPDVFLFDEPLSNLDAKLRNQLRGDIKRLHQQLKTTVVYVTHDQLEAMTLADRVVLMKGGRVEQIGPPAEIYNRPRTLFAAGFIGTPSMNFIPGHIRRSDTGFSLHCVGEVWHFSGERFKVRDGQDVIFGMRPNHLQLRQDNGQAGRRASHPVSGTLDLVELLGSEYLVSFSLCGIEATALVPGAVEPKVGTQIELAFDERDVHLFDADTGISLAL